MDTLLKICIPNIAIVWGYSRLIGLNYSITINKLHNNLMDYCLYSW